MIDHGVFSRVRSSSSPADGSPVRVAARRPSSRLATSPGNGQGRSPASGAITESEGAVRNMKRTLRRRYSAGLRGGQGSAEPFGIGAKAMEAAKSLEAQP